MWKANPVMIERIIWSKISFWGNAKDTRMNPGIKNSRNIDIGFIWEGAKIVIVILHMAARVNQGLIFIGSDIEVLIYKLSEGVGWDRNK